MAFINQLEPWGLLREFSLAPPAGFRSLTSVDGVPMFDTPFDLLTTADDAMRASLRRVPGLPRLLRWRTRFVGSTVSEYALFPSGANPLAMARQLRVEQGDARALLIVKDLPTQSPLLSEDENAWSSQATPSASATRGPMDRAPAPYFSNSVTTGGGVMWPPFPASEYASSAPRLWAAGRG